jgi:hypothetical protein
MKPNPCGKCERQNIIMEGRKAVWFRCLTPGCKSKGGKRVEVTKALLAWNAANPKGEEA